MLRISTRLAEDELVIKLEGCLAGDWVGELDTFWRRAAESPTGRRMRVDLTDVCHVDEAGRELMTRMYRAGSQFDTTGCVMPEVVREISESVDAHALPGGRK
jgi:anti-anti-sigma regulatory factor